MTARTGTIIAQPTGQADLLGQTVVVIGGSSGIGLETARRASLEGAGVVLTAATRGYEKQPVEWTR